MNGGILELNVWKMSLCLLIFDATLIHRVAADNFGRRGVFDRAMKKRGGCLGHFEIYATQLYGDYMGIILNHCKDPY